MSDEIRLPHNEWWPRPHQIELWKYLQAGGKRAMAVWHRRAGKDEIALHACAMAMHKRVGNYWHVLPLFNQARRTVWDAVNPHSGIRRIDEVFPQSLRASTRDTDMHLRMLNGSTFTCLGSDEYSRMVGSSAAGVTFSEYALCNPSAWGYMRPMLEENDGWAVFITTPRGRNHAFELSKYAARSPGWFYELLTVKDTGALTQAQLDETLAEYLALYGDAGQGLFDQEYNCDWHSQLLGSFYNRELKQVRDEGRIMECEPLDDVINWSWDIGIGDDTSCWAFQVQPSGQLLILDHLAASSVGVEWWRDQIFQREQQRGWRHGSDLVPHDAKVKEWGSGRTRVETMAGLGLKPILVPLASIDDGINAVRRTLPLCVFHPRCEDGGISALEQYCREWDDEKKCFKPTAIHNWTSHPADSFRYLSQGWRSLPKRVAAVPRLEGWSIPQPSEPRRGEMRL